MKKIIVVSNLYYPYIIGGAEIICQKLSEGLSSLGYEVTILTIAKGRTTTYETINNLKVIRVKNFNLYFIKQKKRPSWWKRRIWHVLDIYNPFIRREVDKIIASVKPDVAICHNITGFSISIWDCLHAHHIPIIEVLHDQYLLCPNSNAFKRGSICGKQCFSCRLMRLPHRSMSNKVNAVVGVSKFVLNRITDLGYFEKSRKYVVHNAQNIVDKKKETFWNGNRPLKLGYIGNLSDVKGVWLLIEAFKKLNIDAELLIAGKGTLDYEKKLRKLAMEDNRIKFLGYMNSAVFYDSIDICILPSVWPDTFPGVAYESCAHYVPVIASKVGGIPEIIHENRNGLLVPAGDVEELCKSIKYLYDNPKELIKYSSRARSEVIEMLDTNNWILTYESIINSLYSG